MEKKVDLFNLFEMHIHPTEKHSYYEGNNFFIFLEGRNELDKKWYYFPRWNCDVAYQNSEDDKSTALSIANNIWFYGCQERNTNKIPLVISERPHSEVLHRFTGESDISNRLGIQYAEKRNFYFETRKTDLSLVTSLLAKEVHGTDFKFDIGF